MSGCPQCGATEVRWTGNLGYLTWASCRYCGAEYATLTTDPTGLDENGDATMEYAPDEQARHEAEDDYLATCYGHYLHEQDESSIDREV